jgi:hypothetical protein
MVAALTMNYMRATRKEANPVEATMNQEAEILESRVIKQPTLRDMALRSIRHHLGCLWSRPSYAFLGAILGQVPA